VIDQGETAAMLRRIRTTSAIAWIVFIFPSYMAGGWRGIVGLTCSAAVTMISFLWLEEIVETVLQPTPRLRAWKVTLRVLTRFVLVGAAVSVTIIIARFNALSVLLGFSIIVVGIMGEALYINIRGFTE